jgi:hypothetical protein
LPNDDAENFEVDARVICQDSSPTNAPPTSEEQSEEEITDSMGKNSVILLSKVVLHTVSQTKDLQQSIFNKSNCERILELLFERVQKFSEKYNDAWNAVKRNNPALFNKDF